MKKFLLCFAVLTSFFGQLAAQNCMPDPNLSDSAIVYPLPYLDTLAGSGILDTSCVNAAFQTVIQFKIPEQVVTQFGTFPINSVEVPTTGGVLNKPASMSYVCNPPNCKFLKNTTVCIALYGTAQAGEEGTYDLKVNVTIRSTLDLPFTLPDGTLVTGHYYLFVKPEGSANCTVVGVEEPYAGSLTAYNRPNPLNDYTEIVVDARTSGQFRFTVTDLLGKPVYQKPVYINSGENIISFDAGNLPAGFYLYALDNGKAYTSGKMLVSRR